MDELSPWKENVDKGRNIIDKDGLIPMSQD